MSDSTFTSELTMRARGSQLKVLDRARVLGLIDRFVFVSLLALIVIVAIPFGTVEPWWISLYECVVFCLGALWLIEGSITGSWGLSEKQLLAPAAALVAFMFLQTVTLPWAGDGAAPLNLWRSVSADPFETRLVFLKLLAFAINALLLLRYTSNRRRIRTLIHVVIGVGVASALFGIVRQTMQHNETGFILPYLRRNSGFGQFVNKNHFAFLMEMAIGLATGFIAGGAVRRERLLLYVSAVALMWTALVLTSSRGGIFSMFGQIVFLIAMVVWLRRAKGAAGHRNEPQSSRAWRAGSILATLGVGACIVAVVAVSAVWVGGDLLVTRMESLPAEVESEAREPHSGVRRREVWGATWNLIKAHPLIGSGFGAYDVAITKFHNASGKWAPEAAHNDYLELLASGGLVGGGLVVWFGFVFIKTAHRQLLSSE